MIVIREPEAMRRWTFERRAAGDRVGLVPTMGALHEGHLSLIRASIDENEYTVVSIFVNPAQFAPHEDFDQYPRDFESDSVKIEALGGDVIYAPKASLMYPKNYATYVEVERLQDDLCGITRPHFFRGVATVVAKLFNAVYADRAYFGQKDGQQISIIKRMVRDLDFGIEIVALPTVRESDGLAMSSRNQYLSTEDRARSLCISRSLFDALEMMEHGERDAAKILDSVRAGLSGVEVDYVRLVDADELQPVERVEGTVMLAVAATLGQTRLIDNIRFECQKTGSLDVMEAGVGSSE